MKLPLVVVGIVVATVVNCLAQTNFTVLTREHTDLRILYDPGASNVLNLAMRDEDRRANLASNEVILVVKDQARLTLPAGTPFGNAGQPFWILPQTQNPNLLYLGVSAEGIPAETFDGPLTVSLKQLDGPGYLMAWQATGPGQFNIRVNTRDGISAADRFTPIIGSHEHFNWGFSSTGVFSATFQVTGRRIGESTNLTSPECTFVFHVQPLPPPTNFITWQRSFWPPGFNPNLAGPTANPDDDAFDNWREYAFGLSPTNANALAEAPRFTFVEEAGQRFGALNFTRFKPALDLHYAIEVTGDLSSHWTPLENVTSIAAGNDKWTERVTVRDTASGSSPQRFFRLNIEPR